MEGFEITWEAPEFEYREKSVEWFWLSIIVAVLILGAAVWQRNFLLGFFVIIAEILVLVWSNRKPRTIGFQLTREGLTINNEKYYAYAEIESFAVEGGRGEWSNLFLNFKQKLKPSLRVGLPKDQLPRIREILGGSIPETEVNLSIIDILERFFNF